MIITINSSMKNESVKQHQVCLAERLTDALQAAPQVALDAP
jgi:UDP-N-acetylglucosamine transferase subunit ALG13